MDELPPTEPPVDDVWTAASRWTTPPEPMPAILGGEYLHDEYLDPDASGGYEALAYDEAPVYDEPEANPPLRVAAPPHSSPVGSAASRRPGSRRRLASGARPMAAGHAILGAFVAVGLVGGAHLTGILGNRGAGTVASFDFGAAGTTTTSADPAAVPPGSTGPDAPQTTAASADTTAPVAAVSTRVPSHSDPARVYIAGDSDAGNLGPPLEGLLADTGVVTSKLFYKVSSGLTRPDFFDWPAQLQRDVSSYKPDIVVVTFGGNDAQDVILNGKDYPVSTPEWQAEYRRRVAAVMNYLTEDGRTLIWVGIPNAKSGPFRDRLTILEQITHDEATHHSHVTYVDTWNRFVGASGGYADYIIDPRDNEGKLVRADDGFHLNQTGAEILALDVASAVEDELEARNAVGLTRTTPESSTTGSGTTTSGA